MPFLRSDFLMLNLFNIFTLTQQIKYVKENFTTFLLLGYTAKSRNFCSIVRFGWLWFIPEKSC